MDRTLAHKFLQASSLTSPSRGFRIFFRPSNLKPYSSKRWVVAAFPIDSSLPCPISIFGGASNGTRYSSSSFSDSKPSFFFAHSKFGRKFSALKSDFAERISLHSISVSKVSVIEANQESLTAVNKEDAVGKIQLSLETKFGISMNENGIKNIDYLLTLRAKPHQIRRIFTSNSRFFEEPFYSAVKSKITIFEKFGMNVDVLLKALTKDSDWLLSSDEKITNTLSYLERELAVTNISKVVCNSPNILSLSAKELEKSMSNLSTFELCDINSAVERNPGILKCDKEEIEKRIETVKALVGSANAAHLIEFNPVLIFSHPDSMLEIHHEFRSRFGPNLSEEIFQRHPKLLSEKFEHVQETLDGMIEKFGTESTAHMILSCPVFVKRKWDSLLKKIDYILLEMGRNNEEIENWAPVLALSLQKRLVVRNEALRKSHKHQRFKLRFMFACNDAEFQRRFGIELPSDKRNT